MPPSTELLQATIDDALTRPEREDGWVNPFTGFGTLRDKTTHGRFFAGARLSDVECAALFHHDDMAGKIASLLPEEALKMGWILGGDEGGKIARLFRELNIEDVFLDGLRAGRAFGGAVLFLGANDGRGPTEELCLDEVRSFDFVDLYDKRRATPVQWYENHRHLRYGRPRIYQLSSLRGGISEVHVSRLIRMPGAFTLDQERYENNWWDYSIFEKCHESIKQFNEASKAVELLMVEASQFVYGVAGIINSMSSGQMKTVQRRMELLDMSRSVARAIIVDPDKGETASQLAKSFAGVGDAWDRISIRLCAAAEVPVTVMLGRSPAGENSTGDADFRAWYDRRESYNRRTVLPRIERLVEIAKRATGIARQVDVTFPSPWVETPAEFADRRLKTSQADALDVANQILDPEEIAESRYGGDRYSSETKLNRAKGFGVPGSIVAPRGGGKVGAGPVPSEAPMPPRLPPDGQGAPQGTKRLPPPSTSYQGKPGGGRLARTVPATTGNAWPADTTRPGDEGLTR